MTKSQFVIRLKELRASKNLSQAALAKNVGILKRLYEIYESEKHSSIPTYKNLIVLADLFNCSIDYLLCQTDSLKRYPKKADI